MEKPILTLSFLIISILTINIYAQNRDDLDLIKSKNELWNTAFNERDSNRLFTLYNNESIMISAGGKWLNKAEIKGIIRSLFKRRPDISWYNEIEKIEVNKQWHVAYETGKWTESWTEKKDTTKSTIVGKYWIMYKKIKNQWFVHSAIYTPLTCQGSYCE